MIAVMPKREYYTINIINFLITLILITPCSFLLPTRNHRQVLPLILCHITRDDEVEDEDTFEDCRSSTSDSDQDEDSGEDREERGAGSMSNYEYAKPWGGTGGFMDSYGIDRTPEGYQEANEMVDTMREAAERNDDGGGRK